MFVTYENHKHPLSSAYGRTTQLWRAVEVELLWPWFLIEIELPGSQEEDSFLVTRTMCLSNIDDVIGFSKSDESSESTLRSVAVIESSRATGGGWTMHPIKEIWEAEEPQDRSLRTRILVKTSGEPYSLSMFGTPACEMENWEKIATIPSA